jgi:hypothetical protein
MADDKKPAPGANRAGSRSTSDKRYSTTSGADNLLGRLDAVRRTGAGTWSARCPAHDDRGPSLSIAEKDDGRILVHCHAGCDVEAVLVAIGMNISDLFPPRVIAHRVKSERRPFPAADVLRAVGFEAMVVAAAAVALLAGEPFSEIDRDRLILAVTRIQAAISAAGLSS